MYDHHSSVLHATMTSYFVFLLAVSTLISVLFISLSIDDASTIDPNRERVYLKGTFSSGAI